MSSLHAEESPPSYDRHLAESTPIASSSADPPDLWRPASLSVPRLGSGEDLGRAITAPAGNVKEKPPLDAKPIPSDLLETPPEYARQDPQDQLFALQGPLIFSAPTADGPLVPRFQLAQLRTSTNKPYKLRLRRLTTSECRRLALPGKRDALVEFDEDLTLYLIANTHALFPWSLPEIEIRGCKARTLQGFVELKRTPTAYQFWHITKNEEYDMLRPENERRLMKYGYHAKEEIKRELLFAAEAVVLLSKETKWTDGEGNCVARETKSGLNLAAELAPQRKDALLACWAARCWLQGTIDW